MSIEQNKAVVQRWFEEGWSKGNVDIADEIFAPNLTVNGKQVGPQGPKRTITSMRNAFPDVRVSIEEQIVDSSGEKIATRYTVRGTHKGSFANLAPTGKEVIVSGIALMNIVDGKIVEDWSISDRMNLLEQIGFVTVPGH